MNRALRSNKTSMEAMQKWRGLVRFWGALAAAGAATPLVEGEPACGMEYVRGFYWRNACCVFCGFSWCFHPPNTERSVENCGDLYSVNLNSPQSAETSKVIIRIITLWSLGGNFWMMKFCLDSKSEGSLRPRFWWGKMIFRDPKPLGWPWLTQKLMVTERNLPMLTSHSWIQLEYIVFRK